MIYFFVSNDGSQILSVRETDDVLVDGDYNTKETSVVNGKPFYTLAAVTDPAYDPATQVKEGPVDTYDFATDTATRTYTVRAKTQGELDADQLATDLVVLKDAGKDLALVLTELVQWNLDNTAMVADDFTPSVKQAYLDLKAIADRVK